MKKSLVTIMLFGVFLLAGCATCVDIKQVAQKTPISIPLNQEPKPIQFKKIVIKLKRGTDIGCVQAGFLCIPQRRLLWRGGRLDITSDDLSDIFREELVKANFKVVGNPDALFEDPSEWKAELLVAGLVDDIQCNICYPKIGFGNFDATSGECYMKVNWQIYSRLDRKVIYEVTTEGSYRDSETKDDMASTKWHNAFSIAVNNLLADDKFYNLAISNKTTSSASYTEKIVIKETPLFEKSIQDNMNNVRLSVATVFAGSGSGSGIFVSSDGYILTNEHVVREAKFVKIKLVTGREILGEVIRKDSRRDVALLKAEEKQTVFLPILKEELRIGEEVYALGSPLGEKQQTSVSKGIVSAYRVEDNMKYIQSDVNVLPGSSGGALVDNRGNLAGITVAGRLMRGVPVGLNFFIPIQDALGTLNIGLEAKTP